MSAQLEMESLSEEEIQSLRDFAAEVAEGLQYAEEDFETRRRIIEELDVQVTLSVEDGQKALYARCMPGEHSCTLRPRRYQSRSSTKLATACRRIPTVVRVSAVISHLQVVHAWGTRI